MSLYVFYIDILRHICHMYSAHKKPSIVLSSSPWITSIFSLFPAAPRDSAIFCQSSGAQRPMALDETSVGKTDSWAMFGWICFKWIRLNIHNACMCIYIYKMIIFDYMIYFVLHKIKISIIELALRTCSLSSKLALKVHDIFEKKNSVPRGLEALKAVAPYAPAALRVLEDAACWSFGCQHRSSGGRLVGCLDVNFWASNKKASIFCILCLWFMRFFLH